MSEPWYCMKCGKQMVEARIDKGDGPACFHCMIIYFIHGTGVKIIDHHHRRSAQGVSRV